MEKEIRKGAKTFFGDPMFSRGLARSGHFSLKESKELETYGDTLQQLASHSLAPVNEVEQAFVNEINGDNESALYASKLWKKYLAVILRNTDLHSFSKSSVSSSDSVDFSEGAKLASLDD